MTGVLWVIDAVIAVTLVGLAVLALATADLFRGIVLFIAFGLVMAMAWARLHAVDIALAEAAIGAGLTGALFLNALGDRRGGTPDPRRPELSPPRDPGSVPRDAADSVPAGQGGPGVSYGGRVPRSAGSGRRGPGGAVVVPLLAAGLAGVIGWALWTLPPAFTGLAPHVDEAIAQSGATNPVTAVLLNFRAYDTLLEVGVLLLALVGVWALGTAPRRPPAAAPPGPVLMGLVYVLVPVVGVVGGYLLWAGTRQPGGAFQAGAVLAGLGVLLIVVRLTDPRLLHRLGARVLMALGFAGFLAAGVSSMVAGGRLLEYPAGYAGAVILAIETTLTVSIALVLVALFAGEPADPSTPAGGGDDDESGSRGPA